MNISNNSTVNLAILQTQWPSIQEVQAGLFKKAVETQAQNASMLINSLPNSSTVKFQPQPDLTFGKFIDTTA